MLMDVWDGYVWVWMGAGAIIMGWGKERRQNESRKTILSRGHTHICTVKLRKNVVRCGRARVVIKDKPGHIGHVWRAI